MLISGAFIGAPSSNLALVKPILQHVPQQKSKQLFQYIIRYATDFSVRMIRRERIDLFLLFLVSIASAKALAFIRFVFG